MEAFLFIHKQAQVVFIINQHDSYHDSITCDLAWPRRHNKLWTITSMLEVLLKLRVTLTHPRVHGDIIDWIRGLIG